MITPTIHYYSNFEQSTSIHDAPRRPRPRDGVCAQQRRYGDAAARRPALHRQVSVAVLLRYRAAALPLDASIT